MRRWIDDGWTSKRSRQSSQKMVSTTARREAVEWLRETRSTSLRRACRDVAYRRRLNEANARLVAQLHTHAAARSRFGYPRLHVLIARDGTTVNHKRLYRLSKQNPARLLGLP